MDELPMCEPWLDLQLFVPTVTWDKQQWPLDGNGSPSSCLKVHFPHYRAAGGRDSRTQDRESWKNTLSYTFGVVAPEPAFSELRRHKAIYQYSAPYDSTDVECQRPAS